MDEETTENSRSEAIDEIRSCLLQAPSVIESIFKNLSFRELTICCEVCNSWKAIASSVLRKRGHIYIIPKFEERLNGIFPDIWGGASLAICCGELENQHEFTHSCYDLNDPNEHHETSYEERRQRQLKLIDIINTENDKLMKLLSPSCVLLHIAPFLFPFYDPEGDDDDYDDDTEPAVMVLIPSMDGIEVQPFLIPDSFLDDRFINRREHAQLFLSKETTSFNKLPARKNYPESPIACMVTFADVNLSSRFYDMDLSLQSCAYEETVIIECLNGYFSATGIAFSGKRVQVNCLILKSRRCCTKHCFSMLKNLHFNEKSGIAFSTVTNHWIEEFICDIWPEYFCKIRLLGHATNIRFSSSMNTNVSTLKHCGKCGMEQSCTRSTDGLVIVFITFDGISVKCI